MKISGTSRASEYAITFQFNQNLLFDSEKYYEFEFSFLFNNAECEREDLEMVVFLRDLQYFTEILYHLNTSDESIFNDKWNNITSTCFKVLGRNYQLQINASSACTIRGNKQFIAIDNIILREKSGDNLDEICLDIQITELPETTTAITTLVTDPSTNEDTTLITDETTFDTTETLSMTSAKDPGIFL